MPSAVRAAGSALALMLDAGCPQLLVGLRVSGGGGHVVLMEIDGAVIERLSLRDVRRLPEKDGYRVLTRPAPEQETTARVIEHIERNNHQWRS